MPLFLYSNPVLVKYLLDPLFENQEAGNFPQTYSMHDLGPNYPRAVGHPTGDGGWCFFSLPFIPPYVAVFVKDMNINIEKNTCPSKNVATCSSQPSLTRNAPTISVISSSTILSSNNGLATSFKKHLSQPTSSLPMISRASWRTRRILLLKG